MERCPNKAVADRGDLYTISPKELPYALSLTYITNTF